MIERIQGFKVGNKTFETLLEAQVAGVIQAIGSDPKSTPRVEDVALVIVQQKEKVIDILTTTEHSLPRARKANGGTKRRTRKTEASTVTVPTPGTPSPA